MYQEEYFGYSNHSMNLTIKNDGSNKLHNMELHVLYSILLDTNKIIARCLDFDTMFSVKLSDYNNHINANDVLSDLMTGLFQNTTEHLLFYSEQKKELIRHANDELWNKYKSIRKQRDEYLLNLTFGYPLRSIQQFQDKEIIIKNIINDFNKNAISLPEKKFTFHGNTSIIEKVA